VAKHVLLLPGLGDHRSKVLLKLIKHWPLLGVVVHFQPLAWNDEEPWSSKLTRITRRIDELSERYGKIGLIGISAGASAAVNAYTERPQAIDKLVFICGKLTGPEAVNPRYYRQNTAFKHSLYDAQPKIRQLTAKDKAKMLSVRPLQDNIVAVKYTKINGVRQMVMLSAGHILSIGLALTAYSPLIARFFKREQNE
jgi:pimeloyl-ACP methyl ester carboxylesterase